MSRNRQEIFNRYRADYGLGASPIFTGGTSPASFQISSDQITLEEQETLEDVHDIYLRELSQLTAAWLTRKQTATESAVCLEANPSEKKNIVLKYWRLDRQGLSEQTPKPAENR